MTVTVVGGVVVVAVVIEALGLQISKVQNVGSNVRRDREGLSIAIYEKMNQILVIGADSGLQKSLPDTTPLPNKI